ncbi:FecR domain-containing protein [uncultured Dokdonia sp.]|uniref:FecR family protein n=1 Tax=uncultured Dokdonia sp. TaxID=575653 RepID=UPI002619A371|nr:FecR domain-containing protein [uncultured Dokdonia sp.]
MKREELIKKWLDNELDAKELQLFEKLDGYEDLLRISNGVQNFRRDSFDTDLELIKLKKAIAAKNQQKNWLKPLVAIAAAIVILFGIYHSFTMQGTEISTLASQKQEIALPDHSSVSLNSLSSLVYNEKEWDTQREVQLQGEAFFKVEKGSTFHVKTATGLVTVVGTQFTVKDRDELFEVVCYEGAVRVDHLGQSIVLQKGDRYIKMDGITTPNTTTNQSSPSWITNTSSFKSMPYSAVLAEFERQYDVKITATDIDSKQLFTGSFIHDNMDVALKSITLPLNLKYIRTNRMITLKGE